MAQTYISGAGGGGKGGGGGSARVAVESPDTLHSKQYAKVLDLISEGEIEGLVNGLQSVYLDKTSVQNPDGTYNFTGVTVEFREGTQVQDPVIGYRGTEVESSVGVEIPSATPLVQTITDPDIDIARLTLGVPRLSKQNITTGDISGSRIDLKVEVQSNGGGYKDALITLKLTDTGLTYTSTAISSNGATLSATTTGSVGILANLIWDRPVTGTTTIRVENSKIENSTGLFGQGPSGTGYYFFGAWVWNSGPFGTASAQYSYQAVNTYGGTPPTVKIEYRNLSTGGAWNVLSQKTFPNPNSTLGPYSSLSLNINSLGYANYEFRVTKLSGSGTVKLTNVSNYTKLGIISIVGKTVNKYQRNVSISLVGSAPWDIRITKLTADSNESNLVNGIYWDSYTSIITEKLSYPNSAYAYVKVDAEQFSRIPARAYHVKLLRVRVPTNYDPNTKIYTGLWDGSFKVAWTSNPAWCFYDLVTNTRYGLGMHIPESQIDKWDLYTIGKYCDELVPDGMGGQESRFTLNIYLQTREEAYTLIQSLSSVFRGMTYWDGGSLSTIQDAPSDPVAIFSKSNIVGGNFNYSGTSIKARHTIALVTWNDPLNFFKQKVEYVEDKESIARYGIKEAEIIAVGCTSRGQASRVGKWLLFSEKEETETVVFKSGLDGTAIKPGEIIQVADADRAGIRFSGRLGANSTVDKVYLDAPTSLAGGVVYTISVVMPYGSEKTLPNGSTEISNLGAIETSTFVPSSTGSFTELDLNTPLSVVPKANTMWAIAEANLEMQLFRVLEVTEEEPNIYQVTAIEHNASKFDAIDKDELLESVSSSYILDSPLPPTNLEAEEVLYISEAGTVKVRIQIAWDILASSRAYRVEYRANEGNWQLLAESIKSSEVSIDDSVVGSYDIRVYSIDSIGRRSGSAAEIVDFVTLGKTAPPAIVQNFTATEVKGGILLSWNNVPDVDLGGYTVKRGEAWETAIVLVDKLFANSFTDEDPGEGLNFYLIRAVDTSGNESTQVTSASIQLVFPEAVRRFIAVQNKATIQLNWQAVEGTTNYEIREGTAWGESTFITRTDSTYFSLASGLEGVRVFLIKAISLGGIYSELASFSTTNVVALPDRNILATIDKELDNYAGRFINTVNNGNKIQLNSISESKGEFITGIDLGYFVMAQNTPYSTLSVAQIDTLAWEQSTFSWLSGSASTRAWLPAGDTDIFTVAAEIELSIDSGSLPTNYVDAIRLDGSSTTYNGTTLLESVGAATFTVKGRVGSGLEISDLSTASWNISIPSVFSLLIWVNPSEDFNASDSKYSLFSVFNSSTLAYLAVSYQNGIVSLESSDNTTQEVVYTFEQDKLYAIAISYTGTQRKIMCSSIYGANNAVLNTSALSTSTTYNTLRLY